MNCDDEYNVCGVDPIDARRVVRLSCDQLYNQIKFDDTSEESAGNYYEGEFSINRSRIREEVIRNCWVQNENCSNSSFHFHPTSYELLIPKKFYLAQNDMDDVSQSPASTFSPIVAVSDENSGFISTTSPASRLKIKKAIIVSASILDRALDNDGLHPRYIDDKARNVLNYLGAVGFRILLCQQDVGIVEYTGDYKQLDDGVVDFVKERDHITLSKYFRIAHDHAAIATCRELSSLYHVSHGVPDGVNQTYTQSCLIELFSEESSNESLLRHRYQQLLQAEVGNLKQDCTAIDFYLLESHFTIRAFYRMIDHIKYIDHNSILLSKKFRFHIGSLRLIKSLLGAFGDDLVCRFDIILHASNIDLLGWREEFDYSLLQYVSRIDLSEWIFHQLVSMNLQRLLRLYILLLSSHLILLYGPTMV